MDRTAALYFAILMQNPSMQPDDTMTVDNNFRVTKLIVRVK